MSWGSSLNRSSQHSVLSSQTLGDLYEAIPCPSNEIPSEDDDANAEFIKYHRNAPSHKGTVIYIEGVAYGDGQAEEDYAESVLSLFPKHERIRGLKSKTKVPTKILLFYAFYTI